MKTFNQLFNEHTGEGILKWSNYGDIYDKHFEPFRDQNINVLEIGVLRGGSMRMWEKYFPKANIFGIDINEDCLQFQSDRTKIFIGDQSDVSFLRNVKAKIPKIDILIDDGSHRAKDQVATFEEMYYHVRKPGVYVVEDIEQNYWASRDRNKPENFMEFMKRKIDELNVRRTMHRKVSDSYPFKDTEVRFTNSTNNISFYENMVVLDKKEMPKNREIRTDIKEAR
tara:strand:+ start:465 stop:1139 length:675 start_codon:yes stop_codon:yes gene_type:complete